MEIDHNKIFSMPIINGPFCNQANIPDAVYERIETLILQYETDPMAISHLLPAPFKPGKIPLVTVLFIDNNGVDFMEGGGYRFASISITAQFYGKDCRLEGDYVLLMPENSTIPIITGREWLGMPKFYADILPIRVLENGHLRCEASLWGHLLFGIDIASPLKKQNSLICKAAGSQFSKSPSFGYKYIASLNGPPDADYPTVMWNKTKLSNLWLGKTGDFFIGDSTRQDIGYFKPGIDALKSLPVRKIIQTGHALGSMVLRNNMNGRLW